jgi:hypothetical protein
MPTTDITCPACGAVVQPDQANCDECGVQLPTEGVAPAVPTPEPTAPSAPAAPTAAPELGPNQWYSTKSRGQTIAGRAGVFSDLPVEVPHGWGGRLAMIGLLVAALSLLLPWAPVANFISYFDAWGLGRPSTIGVFLLAILLLILGLEPVPLPTRVRTGWLPVLFGAFGAGLVWARVDAGLANIDLGGWLFALGAGLALAGGLYVLVGGTKEPSKG